MVGEFDSRTDAFDYDRWAEQGYDFAPFSYICNMSGQPAASIPVPQQDAPPCAIQLTGHLGQDHLLLQLSALLEEELDWQAIRPPIWAGDV